MAGFHLLYRLWLAARELRRLALCSSFARILPRPPLVCVAAAFALHHHDPCYNLFGSLHSPCLCVCAGWNADACPRTQASVQEAFQASHVTPSISCDGCHVSAAALLPLLPFSCQIACNSLTALTYFSECVSLAKVEARGQEIIFQLVFEALARSLVPPSFPPLSPPLPSIPPPSPPSPMPRSPSPRMPPSLPQS